MIKLVELLSGMENDKFEIREMSHGGTEDIS